MKKNIRWIIAVVLLAALLAWVFWANTALELNVLTVTEEDLPAEFDGFRIAHISDLHSAEFGRKNLRLIDMLGEAQPDIIAITGDLMDCRNTSAQTALEFAAQAVQIAPCYYITGNHEVRLSHELYDALITGLTELGVTVLDDREAVLNCGEDAISIVGHFWGETENIGEISAFDGYRILLSHQPEDMDNYAAAGFDLVLSGHAHGGQFRLPLVGGLYAPGQGFFPEYDAGLYSSGSTDMVVSRGLGNSTIPLRLNNRPEVVLIVLECLTPKN